LATCSSVSYKYARKKAVAMSLKIIANKLQTQLENEALYKQNESVMLSKLQEQQNLEKEKIQQKHQSRNNAHSKKMEIRRKQKDIDAQLEDQKRRVKKQELKEKKSRKGADTIYRSYTAEEIAAMSVSKRRNLQDKGIISKGI